jgi:cyclophilin family peptidyl-prolyl cis-trans isomerase
LGVSHRRARPRPVAAALLAGAAAAAALGALPTAAPAEEPSPVAPRPEDVPPLEAVVVVPEFGEFRVRLFRDEVPNHVSLFLTLAQEGYYDGLEFHRIVPRLLIQTGDPATREGASPESTGAASPYRIPFEETARTHERGTVSMAWRDDRPGTAGPQWFVSLEDNPGLDGRATPIGQVVEGMEVVDAIAQVTTHPDRRPRRRVGIERIRLEMEGETPDAPDAIPGGETGERSPE